MQIARKTCDSVRALSRIAHIVAPTAVALLACPALAQPPRQVVLAEPSADDPATAELARALRPHFASADVTLRVVEAVPPTDDDDLLRAAWGAEVAARESADAVLWLEADADGRLVLRMVDARARVQQIVAPPGDRFDQVRTVALAVRSHVSRAIERARGGPSAPNSAGPDTAPPSRPETAPALDVEPLGAAAAVLHLSAGGLAGSGRLEGGLRLGRFLELRAGVEVLLPEDLDANDAGTAGRRTRLPVGLLVATVVPVGAFEVTAGIEGLLSVAFLQAHDGASRTRVDPLLGVRATLRHRLGAVLFLEFPLSLRLRIAAPGGDPSWTDAAVAPGFEGSLGVSVGVGG